MNDFQNSLAQNKGKAVKGLIITIAMIFGFIFMSKMLETVSASEIVVIQSPTGTLEVYNTPGVKPQLFGTITRYKKSFQYWFSKPKNGDDVDESIKVRFNDGGHGQISGSCRVDLPLDKKSMLILHTRYGSQDALESALVRTNIEKAVYMTGPLMSSKESSSTKRTDLINFISDQAELGVYKTRTVERRIQEEGSDSSKLTTVVEILKDGTGNFQRQEKSPFSSLHIGFANLSINALDYDPIVEKQIRSQQELTMQVQTAMAQAKKAEQEVFTTQKQGEATAAKAKWDQEAIKAKAVTEAEQELAVQKLKAEKAAQYEQEQIRIGRGDGERKRLAMAANGALDQKLDAWVKSQQYMWEAFAKYQGNIVPLYQTGGSGGSNALDFMQIMGMKAAKDLNLDMTNKK
jgi:hypothetical protein